MRDINLGREADEQTAAAVGMTGAQVQEMYRLLAVAKYEDRYVIPTAHTEIARELDELGSRDEMSCSLDYDGGPGMGGMGLTGGGPFGETSGSPVPVAVENFHVLQARQTADSPYGPSTPVASTSSTGTATGDRPASSRRARGRSRATSRARPAASRRAARARCRAGARTRGTTRSPVPDVRWAGARRADGRSRARERSRRRARRRHPMRRAPCSRPRRCGRGTAPGPQPDHLAPVATTAAQRRTAHMAASLLLAYPDEDVLAAVDAVRASAPGLPGPVRERLEAFCDVLTAPGAPGLRELQARYVATFDLKRKCSMYLSYYAAGDTRRRGTALVAFVEAYRAAGWEVTGSELPDYLPTVLEFSARTTGTTRRSRPVCSRPTATASRCCARRSSARSPWTGLVEAVCLTLPPLDERTQQRYVELVTAGPPAELVGMEPFALEPYGTGTPDRTGGAVR